VRFIVRLKSDKPSDISIDYRRRFISFLKNVFEDSFNSFNGTKPYVFSVFFGKNTRIEKDKVKNVETINFRFSTGDFIVAVKFYNGALRLKKENYLHKIGSENFKIEWIKKEDEKEITGIFKTLSPVIVERIGYKNGKDMEERYVVPNEDDFEISLLENILRRHRSIYGKDLSVTTFKFKEIKVKKTYVKHYGGYLKCFLGKFKIETDSEELLKFIYDFGLGLRTGQGFGYLDTLRGWSNDNKCLQAEF